VHRTFRTGTAVLGAIALAAAVTVSTGAGSALAGTAAAQRTTVDRAEAAAGFLARHLKGKNDDHYIYEGTTYADYGGTADGVMSMAAAGAARAAQHRATDYLAAHVDDYAVTPYGTYPGAVAKLMLVAHAQHRDVHDFGGTDLVSAVLATEGAEGAAAGEFQQNPGYPDSDSYIVSQALPVLALTRVGEAGQPDDAAVSFLVDQQCANGGFASLIRDDTSTDCTDNDVDATGYAVQALVAAGADEAAAAGLDWLVQAAHDSGGFGTTVTERSNANSTALAAQALIAGQRTAGPAKRWLRHHQVLCAGKAARRGAVTFQGTYDGTAVRATSQAGTALAGKSLAGVDSTGSYKAAPVLDC
jgi:hypothetical protein